MIHVTPTHTRRQRHWLWIASISLAALLSLALKLWLAYTTVGTNDVTAWERFATTAQHVGGAELYRREALFNHPPFMVHLLHLQMYLTQYTGLPFPLWLRLPAILADLGTVIVVWKILAPPPEQPGRRAALFLLAVAPPLIMISGFHGNTDPVMISFVVLAVYLLERRAAVIPAGIALGLALSIKIVPVIFLPAMVCYLATWRARLTLCVAAATVWSAGALPYLVQAPQSIVRQVFAYAGNYGQWGISRIAVLRAARAHPAATWAELEHGPYTDIGRVIIMVSIVAAALWLNRSPRRKPSLFVQCGLVVFLFLALSPAFGVQYLAWLMPWVVALGFRATLVLYTASSIFLFQVYTFWSGGFPWYFANSPDFGWQGQIIAFELLCWIVVVMILGYYVVTVRKIQEDSPRPPPVGEHSRASMMR